MTDYAKLEAAAIERRTPCATLEAAVRKLLHNVDTVCPVVDPWLLDYLEVVRAALEAEPTQEGFDVKAEARDALMRLKLAEAESTQDPAAARDLEWTLAIAAAYGRDSNFHAPLFPDAFAETLKEVRDAAHAAGPEDIVDGLMARKAAGNVKRRLVQDSAPADYRTRCGSLLCNHDSCGHEWGCGDIRDAHAAGRLEAQEDLEAVREAMASASRILADAHDLLVEHGYLIKLPEADGAQPSDQ